MMGFEFNPGEWTILLFRVLHIVTAIAWIGASFYFVWLDMNLRPVPEAKHGKGLYGDLWAIHGGGIYEVQKYTLAPPQMPQTLHWFKWEAYSTWLTGSALLVFLYYGRAQTYLIDGSSWVQEPSAAILASICFLALSVGGYEVLVRRRSLSVQPLAALIVLWLGMLCWLAFQLFSQKAAPIHIGAAMASIMAANVLLGIIPGQRALVQAIESGGELDPEPALAARKRSLHNNYLTLPVVLCMVSNHSMFLYGHSLAWAVLIALMLNAAYLRHFFNLRHQGILRPSIIVISAVIFVLTAMVSDRLAGGVSFVEDDSEVAVLTDQHMLSLVTDHCGNCHALQPTIPGYAAAPGGIVLDSLGALNTYKARTVTSLKSGYMPLGNMGGLTNEQRAAMLRYLE
ncbi:urate hydroxylase PuuD [Gammaproteobacteria bacterium]|nr:urate hydroxylase PuuD [Gammaproteobacteria bacterium]